MTFLPKLLHYRCPDHECRFRCRYKFNLRMHIKDFHPELVPFKSTLKGGVM